MRNAALALALMAFVSAHSDTAPAESCCTMQRLPAGFYNPFYARESAKVQRELESARRPVAVGGFWLDRHAVTNREFLDFVQNHPEWRKSRIKPIFADAHYLDHWRSDLALPNEGDRERPVTNVSWFAAEAYCRAQGKTLPTTDQWEYALADRGSNKASLRTRILTWYGTPGSHPVPVVQTSPANSYGVSGLVGLVWEWTLDFNSLLSGPDLRGPESGSHFCGGGSLGVADATDYAAFMRYSMRESLKASYTTRNLGFRCAKNLP